MTSGIKPRRLIVLSITLLIFALSVYPPSALALGTPQITKVDPGSPAPVGTCIAVRARVNWDSEFRSMRMRFGNEGWQEEATPEFERTFCTGNLSPGWYTIRVEVARQGDNNWSSPTVAEASYQLLPGAQPTPVPTSPPSPSCSIQSISVTPTSGTIGTIFSITGSGACSTGVRAVRFKVDGGVVYELGAPSATATWNSTGTWAGWHTATVEVAGWGDNDWAYAASSSVSFEVTATAAPPPSGAPAGPSISQVLFTPSNGAQVGQTVNIHIKVDSVNPGAIRINVPCGTVQHVEHTVPEYDTAWFTSGCGSGTQTVRVCARHVEDLNWQNATCVERTYVLNGTSSGGSSGETGSDACPSAPTRLSPGQIAVVSDHDPYPINVRAQPGLNSQVLFTIPIYEMLTIISGPQCRDGNRWYEVGYNGQGGWASEVGPSGIYNLIPNGMPMPGPGGDESSENNAGGTTDECPDARRPDLHVGGYGRVPPQGGDLEYTSIRDIPQGAELTRVPVGGVFVVVDGPTCTVGQEGHLWWWKVEYQGITGWMPGGYTHTNPWIEPYTPPSVPADRPTPTEAPVPTPQSVENQASTSQPTFGGDATQQSQSIPTPTLIFDLSDTYIEEPQVSVPSASLDVVSIPPERVNVCNPECAEHENWVEFRLRANSYVAATPKLHTSLLFAWPLAAYSTPTPRLDGDYIVLRMGLSHRLLQFLTFNPATRSWILAVLRDPNNWWLTYQPTS